MRIRTQPIPDRRLRQKTRSEELRAKIEDGIVTGAFPPGTRLDEPRLAELFGVSRTPIREALIQLASMGIVETRARRGTMVPNVSLKRMVEMFEGMAEIEAICGRLAARRMSGAEHTALLRAHEACRAAGEVGDPSAYYDENEHFHHLIHLGSHNSFVDECASALSHRLRGYRRRLFEIREWIKPSSAEHQAIIDAIMAGDPRSAADRLRRHILVQSEQVADLAAILTSSWDSVGTPDPFSGPSS